MTRTTIVAYVVAVVASASAHGLTHGNNVKAGNASRNATAK
jgi:hypothetical protein